ncbi:hypothetical protein D3C76_1569370 [compost metagenome]
MLLGEVAELNRCAQLYLTAVRLQPAGDQVKQRRFAAAVRADNTDAVLRNSNISQVLDQGPAVHRLGQILHLNNLASQPR